MTQSRAQITVFIIIGIALLFIVGAAMYITSSSERQQLELAKPRVSEIPERAQPVRDVIESCANLLGEDGLRAIGDSGGYINSSAIRANPLIPTEGEGVQLAPLTNPPIAYWWYMKSKNQCTSNCEFASKRPPLYKTEGSGSIEGQLDKYISENLPACLGQREVPGCTIRERGAPNVDTRITQRAVNFLIEYPLNIVCEDQTFTVNDYATQIPLNFEEIYEIATNLTNYEIADGVLEQATVTVLTTFSGVDEQKLPPFRGLEFGGISPGTFWIKHEVLNKIKQLLTAYVPAIQAYGARNYNYVSAPQGIRDPELYELVYNRQFMIPLNKTYPDLDVRFSYYDWWEPHFDLNCNGQLCRADTGTNFFLLPFSINRYEFAYDLSYPVLVEVRNSYAFNGEGYSFNFMLEQNLRNSARFSADTQLLEIPQPNREPSLFCNPEQRTSGIVELAVKDGETLRPVDRASVAYICGQETCNIGDVFNGTFLSRLPPCIGGSLLITKPNYLSYVRPLDSNTQEKQELAMTIEPIRTLKATVKNYVIGKIEKKAPWEFEPVSGLQRPNVKQETLITLTKKTEPDEDPFFAFVDLKGAQPADIQIGPGKYTVSIISLLRDDITIEPDERCFSMKKITSSKKECYDVPEKPIKFNETTPFPTGIIEYDVTIRPDDLRGAKTIEFRHFVLGIDKIEKNERVIEDLGEIQRGQIYTEANPILVWPVIGK